MDKISSQINTNDLIIIIPETASKLDLHIGRSDVHLDRAAPIPCALVTFLAVMLQYRPLVQSMSTTITVTCSISSVKSPVINSFKYQNKICHTQSLFLQLL